MLIAMQSLLDSRGLFYCAIERSQKMKNQYLYDAILTAKPGQYIHRQCKKKLCFKVPDFGNASNLWIWHWLNAQNASIKYQIKQKHAQVVDIPSIIQIPLYQLVPFLPPKTIMMQLQVLK